MTIAFPPKHASAIKKLVFDFISDLAVGETISTQTVTASVWSGTDASPSAIINGAATAAGTKVTQTITGGVVGVFYKLTCTITTSAGQTLIMIGYLAIISDPL